MAKPVDPKMGADLLNITPAKDQDLVKNMLDQPWNIHDKELIAPNTVCHSYQILTTCDEVWSISSKPT
jgi:hypothetical protein